MNIGLSQRVLLHKNRAYDALEQGWYTYLKSHTLFPIANRPDQNFDSLASVLDCFIITGGDDHPLRRLTELRLAKAMLLKNKKIIGICHGAFLLTEILGGEIIDVSNHYDRDHQIEYNRANITVNSYHSIAIKTAPKSSRVLAIDSENNCESWIDNKIAAVVWHPERMDQPWVPDEIAQLFDK